LSEAAFGGLELKTGNVGGQICDFPSPPHLNTRESQVRDTTVAFHQPAEGKIEEARRISCQMPSHMIRIA